MAAIEYTITKPDAYTVKVQYGTETLHARLNIEKQTFEINRADGTTGNAQEWEDFADDTKMPVTQRNAYRDATSVVSTASDNFYLLKLHATNADGTFTFTAMCEIKNNITIIHDNEAYLVTNVQDAPDLPDGEFTITAVKSEEPAPLVKPARA